jgi:hypothetical protein
MLDSLLAMADSILKLIIRIGNEIIYAIVAVEGWLRTQLRELGLSPALQTTILATLLVAVPILLIFGSTRLLGGVLRVVVTLVLLLVVMSVLFPILRP